MFSKSKSVLAARSGRLLTMAMAGLALLATIGIIEGSPPSPASASMPALNGSFNATGFFHIAQATNGHWWFVDPKGHPFYSTGIDHVSASPDVDVTTNQCPYCEAIASQFPSTAAWVTATVAELRSWGFNTIGDYSDSSTFAPLMPYTVQLTMASGNDWFAPSFVTHADQVAASQAAPLANDPNLIGYYTDSELAWGPNEDNSESLLNQYLALPAGSPGLAEAQQYIGNPSGFTYDLATRYFSVTSAALHLYDPNHLNLGVKAESNDIPPELLEAASHYVDAFSIDDYALQPGEAVAAVNAWHYLPIEPNFANFESLVNKPIIIAEYSFRATGPNTPNTVPNILATYPTQAARAAAYTNYIGTMYQTAPWVIGDHWFEYVDEPKGGRFDGENNNFGLVSTANVPYEAMVQAVTLMHTATADKAIASGPECDSFATTAGNTTCTAYMPAISEPLTITNSTLTTADYQIPYSEVVVVGGGTPNYIYSLTSGQLPNGLSLNTQTGLISGTPTALGTFNFTVGVTDSATSPATTSMPYSLSVVQTELSDQVPTMTSITPPQGGGAGGGTVTIKGTGFTQGLAGPTFVLIGGVAATNVVVNAAGTQLTATVPPGTTNGTVPVALSNPAGAATSSSPITYTYVFAQPTVSSISPTSGSPAGGTPVNVSGNAFAGATSVKFGGAAAHFVVNSDNSLIATAPSGTSGSVADITVTGPGGTSITSSADQFTYGPIVTGVSPNSGGIAGGTSVVIQGAQLSGATAVAFGATAASSFTVTSATSITAVSPPGTTGSVNVTVTTSRGATPLSPVDTYTYINPTPVVTGLSPANGSPSGGTSVSVTGSSFVGATSVNFGSTPATSFIVNSATSITAVAPTGSGGTEVAVTVTNASGTSNLSSADQFAYGPQVTGLSPNSGNSLGGTNVTIRGAGLSGATAVTFGSTPALSFIVNSATSISAVSPPGTAASVNVTVTTPNGTSGVTVQDQFRYIAAIPTLTGLSPADGPSAGGTVVMITGGSFTGATTVSFGTNPASSFTVNSASSITATTPAGLPLSTVEVTVTGPGGTSLANSAYQFTYGSVVTAVTPNMGNYLGGTSVTIKGAGLTGATAVNFASTPATTFTVNGAGTQINATSPGGDAGLVDITVTVGTSTTAITPADVFTYVAQGAAAVNGAPITVSVDASNEGSTAINQGLIGVNHIPTGSASQLQAIGTSWARTDVSFETTSNGQPVYNCTTGAWNPAYLDSHVALNNQAGAQTELIIDYTPPCLATNPPAGINPNYTPPDIGPDQAKWKALVYQMALHEISAEGVTTFEVWNEPNGQFFVAPNQLSAYLTLYQDTAEALESAATTLGVHIEVGGPALAEINTTPNLSWIDGLLSFASTNNLPLDFISWHEYANGSDIGPSAAFPNGICSVSPTPVGPCRNPNLDARSIGAGAAAIEGEIAKYPTLHPLLWLDEWNINAGEDPAMSGSYGAAFVAAVLDSAQSSGISRADIYEAADDSTLDNFGILTSSLAPKPDYQVFAMWHAMSGTQLTTAVAPNQTSANQQGRIGAVASQSGNAMHVLVYNFATTGPAGTTGQTIPSGLTHPVQLTVTGLTPGSQYTVTQTLVDPNNNPSGAINLGTFTAGGTLLLNQTGESVSLLTFTPIV